MSRRPQLKRRLKKKTVPYSQATDKDKVARNWRKAIGLFARKEYSVSVLRCATCLELALNFAVREELVDKLELPRKFADQLLKNANGIHNKFCNLYLPIMEQYEQYDALKQLWNSKIVEINRERNKVAHQGEFRSQKAATKVMENTFMALTMIMGLYDVGGDLEVFPTSGFSGKKN